MPTLNQLIRQGRKNKILKKDGILILGLGETNGFFQRYLQRYILYSLSRDKNELIKLAKLRVYSVFVCALGIKT